MPRRKQPTAAPVPPPPVPVVEPNAVYSLDLLRRQLGLNKTTLSREVRAGRLRVSKRAGRLWTTGAWVLEWLTGNPVRPRAPAA